MRAIAIQFYLMTGSHKSNQVLSGHFGAYHAPDFGGKLEPVSHLGKMEANSDAFPRRPSYMCRVVLALECGY